MGNVSSKSRLRERESLQKKKRKKGGGLDMFLSPRPSIGGVRNGEGRDGENLNFGIDWKKKKKEGEGDFDDTRDPIRLNISSRH